MKFEKIVEKAVNDAVRRGQKWAVTENILLVTIKAIDDLGLYSFGHLIEQIENRLDNCIEKSRDSEKKRIKVTNEFSFIADKISAMKDDDSYVDILEYISKGEKSFSSLISEQLLGRKNEMREIRQYEKKKTTRNAEDPLSLLFGVQRHRNTPEHSKSEEEYPALEEYGENLTQKERRNPLIGREKEIERIYEVLLKKDKPNPVLTGKQGVGKTAIVEEIAIRLKEGNVPLKLREVNAIYSIQMSTLLAGTQYRGDFEEKIKRVFEEVKASNKKVILYIDEMHTMMRAGANPDTAMDAANIMKPYLTDGSIRIIGSTTTDEYIKFIEKDPAMARRLMPVNVDEPSIEDAIKIIDGIKEGYETFHGIKYTDEAVRASVELSAQHIHDRCLPDKAIDLIDEAGAKVSALIYKEEKRKEKNIDTEEIEDVLFSTYKIPKATVAPDEAETVASLSNNLKNKVFGQDEAVEAIIKRIKLAKAGIRDKNKPIANMLFVGPTGTGKTEISKVLAESMKMKLLRFDMSEYQEEHTVAKLFGAPAGYVGYDEGGILTNAVRSEPNSVLLFDEIEKAHPKVYNAFLQIMDYGFMTDSKGVKVDFRNTVIIMTSNAGATQIVKKNLGFGKASEIMDTGAMDEALKSTFTPEFRGRLTDIIKFNDLTPEVAKMIVRKELNLFSQNLAEKDVKISVTDECVEHLANVGYTPMVGARNIRNLISNDISALLVDDLLFGPLKNGGSIKIDWNGEKYVKRCRAKKEKVKVKA